MEIGNEIGQKIRSAIKAKLVELGAYVDDELPDYVMVMVANKKSESQMAEDLSLFLGSNTAKFTAWLHGLLQKLLSITSETGFAITETDSKKTSTSQPNIFPQAAGEPAATVGAKADLKLTVPCSLAPTEVPTSKVMKTKAAVQRKRETTVKPVESNTEEEPVIKLSLEHDEFEEESRVIVETVKETILEGAGKRTVMESFKKTSKDDIKKLLKHDLGKTEEYVPEPVKSSPRILLKDPSKNPLEQRETNVSSARISSGMRKRSVGLESTLGAVVSHEDNDDFYDPHKPAIGNVASVIKVTERKSSVPPSMQANKTLLLIAMKEAERSVAQCKKTFAFTDNNTSQPTGSVHSRLGSVRPSKPVKINEKTTDSHVRLVTVKPTRSVPAMTSNSASSSIGKAKNDRRFKSDHQYVRNQKDFLPKPVDEEEEETGPEAEDKQEVVLKEDTRRIQCDDSDTEGVGLQNKRKKTREIEQRQEADDEEQQLRKILMQQQKPLAERMLSPKFVVTLDGINSSLMSESETAMQMEEDDIYVPMMEPMLHKVLRVKPQIPQPPMAAENMVNDTDYDEESSSQFEPLSKKVKVTDKCKFWPSCKNGDSCSFHHPSLPCKLFPNCRFGDRCLYIHPNCKFDGSCRNPSCPYTHSMPHTSMAQTVPIIMPIRMPFFQFPSAPVFAPVRHRAPAPTQPKQIKCRFFPNCMDMNCAFAHPKPCRYGLSCSSKQSCPFTHPSLPTKSQMKWVSASAQEGV